MAKWGWERICNFKLFLLLCLSIPLPTFTFTSPIPRGLIFSLSSFPFLPHLQNQIRDQCRPGSPGTARGSLPRDSKLVRGIEHHELLSSQYTGWATNSHDFLQHHSNTIAPSISHPFIASCLNFWCLVHPSSRRKKTNRIMIFNHDWTLELPGGASF